MAQVILCDGCGGVGACTKVGHVLRRDYCEGCAERAAAYQGEIDALHERVAQDWKDGLAEIRKTYSSALRVLPDVTQ